MRRQRRAGALVQREEERRERRRRRSGSRAARGRRSRGAWPTRGCDDPAPRPVGERLRDQEEGERAHRVGERLLDHERARTRGPGVATAPTAANSAQVRETTIRARKYAGKIADRHHDHPDVLDRRVGRVDVVDPPERRDEVRVERVEARRVVPLGGDCPVSAMRARDLRVLQLVGEEPRRDVARGSASRRARTSQRKASDERDRAVEAVEATCGSAASSLRCAAPRTTTGSRSVSRRTNRQGIAGGGAGADDGVEPVGGRVRDRDEHGVRAAWPRGSARCRASRRGRATPSRRRRMQARVVVDEADDLLARRLAQLAQQAAARAPGADDQRAAAVALGQRRARAEQRALAEARGADHDHAEQRVEDEDARREVAERRRERRRSRPRPPPRRRRRRRSRPPRASRRTARSPGRGRAR